MFHVILRVAPHRHGRRRRSAARRRGVALRFARAGVGAVPRLPKGRVLPVLQTRTATVALPLRRSDRNLNNNRYKGGDTGETVGDTARYAENHGVLAKR